MDFTISVGHSEYGNLSVETLNTAVDIRFAECETGIVYDKSCGEIVASVDDDIVTRNDLLGIDLRQKTVVGIDFYAPVQGVKPSFGALDLAGSDLGLAVERLALEVRLTHFVSVD